MCSAVCGVPLRPPRPIWKRKRRRLRDVLVSLLSEVALNYLDVRTIQLGIQVAVQNLEAQERSYRLALSRYEAGLTNELSVQQARYNMENTRSKIPLLKTALVAAMNRLSVLIWACNREH